MKKSFITKPVFPKHQNFTGVEAIPHLLKMNPRIFCILARKRNGNLVIFEGNVENNQLVGITHYWLELEPSFMERARKRGRLHDRDEMSMFDDYAYGYVDKCIKKGKKFSVIMKHVASRPMVVVLGKNKEGKNEVNAYLKLGGILSKMEYIWVADDGKLWPKVTHVDVFGLSRHDKKMRERIYH